MRIQMQYCINISSQDTFKNSNVPNYFSNLQFNFKQMLKMVNYSKIFGFLTASYPEI